MPKSKSQFVDEADGETVGPQLLTEQQAACWLSICPRTLWSKRNSGQIPFVRFGRSIRYDIDDLRAFVARNRAGGEL